MKMTKKAIAVVAATAALNLLTACSDPPENNDMVTSEFLVLYSGDEVVGVIAPGVLIISPTSGDFAYTDPGNAELRKILIEIDESVFTSSLKLPDDRPKIEALGGAVSVSNATVNKPSEVLDKITKMIEKHQRD